MSEAKKDQGNDFYPGVDDWKQTTLKAGTIIAQLDYRPEDLIKKGIPVSNYFANGDINIKKVNDLPSAKDLSEQAQVKPFRAPLSKEHTYQPLVSFYEVKKDFTCETSEVKNNPLYGRGGGIQCFINKKEYLAESGHLEFKGFIQTYQKKHNIPFFKKAEESNWNDLKVKALIPKMHEQILKTMESGKEPQRKAAKEIRSLMKESKDLKEGKIPEERRDSKEEAVPIKRGLGR